MTDRKPLYLGRDPVTSDPSSLVEFKSTDVVGVVDGGTGVSSLSLLSSIFVPVEDHGSLAGLEDNDHPQYVLSSTNLALSSLVTTNQTNAEGTATTVFDNSASWSAGGGISDHSGLNGLSENDHPQYVLSSTNLALSTLVSDNQTVFEGVSSTVFDNSASWAGGGVSDHSGLNGLADNDHPQYVLSSTNLDLSSLVTTNQGLSEGVSSTVFDNSSTWATDTNTTDHGAFTGLADDDHPQYVLSATNLTLSSLVTTNQGLMEGVSSTVFDNSSAWAVDTNTTDHGSFTGLADNDHPQYVLSATNLALSTLVTTNQGLMEGVSSTVFDNSGSWSESDYLPLSGGDVTGEVTISRDVDTNTGNVLTLNTDVDNSLAGPVLSLDRDSDSPADGDYLGQIKFKGKNSTGGDVTYSKVTAKTSDVTNSTEDGLLEFANQKDGSQTIVARLTSTDLKLINGTGLEVDGDVSVTGTGPWTTVSSTVFDNSSTWSVDTNTTDHGAFTGLADDDHPQYTLSATNLALSSLVTTNQGHLEGVSSTVFDNSASWGGGGGTTNLSIGTTTTTTVDVNSNTGTNATIPAAIATTAAGLLTGADKSKLDGIEAAAEVNVDTDLSKTVGVSTVTIESSTGTNTEIPAVTGSLAGVLAAAQYNVILTALARVALMEDSATADQTAAEILALLVGEKLATKSVGTDALVNKGTVTGATTIDWNDGNHQEITLGAAAITLTFTAPTQGTAMLVLNVKQDATGGRALTLPSIEYPRSGSPTYSTVADANDLHTFYWNGTTYQGGFGPAMG